MCIRDRAFIRVYNTTGKPFSRLNDFERSEILKHGIIQETQEYFLRYNGINKDRRTSDALCSVLCKALEKFNVQNKLIGQTYDGASVISGELNGISFFTAMHIL